MSEATTVPSNITMLAGETLPLSIDFSLLIVTGETPATPTGVLYDITDTDTPGSVVTQAGALSISGNVVTKSITGLTAGKRYRLVLGCTAVAGKIWQAGLIIVCPF